MMSSPSKYDSWDKDRLISRIRQLEGDLKAHTGNATSVAEAAAPRSSITTPSDAPPAKKRKRGSNRVDASKYNTRFVALKLAYLGKNYGGFEYQACATQPTIEEHLWRALVKAMLVFPSGEHGDDAPVELDKFDYSKCGRTDYGVSAFGQVIAIRLRSSRPLEKPKAEAPATEEQAEPADGKVDVQMTDANETKGEAEAPPPPKKEWDPIMDELDYVKILNKLLPKDIRILAWCPSPPPGFSARFSCIERQYRYFFTQPAYSPAFASHGDPDKPRSGWLDIEAMRTAAKAFVGEHDFRNFCKIDGSKQITNFTRDLFEVDIAEVEDDIASAVPYVTRPDLASPGISDSDKSGARATPKVYSFNVRGSGFLWHQIRMMISILFAVGQGYESPSIVAELLDVEKYPRKPNYQLAHDVPLVLWDCIFPEGEGQPGGLTWLYESEEAKHSPNGAVSIAWETWRGIKMDEILSNRLLDLVAQPQTHTTPRYDSRVVNKAYLGDSVARTIREYQPLRSRQVAPSPQEVNDRWAQRKGFKDSADIKSLGSNWRAAAKKAAKSEVEPDT